MKFCPTNILAREPSMTRGMYMFIASEFQALKGTYEMEVIHMESIPVDMKLSNISA